MRTAEKREGRGPMRLAFSEPENYEQMKMASPPGLEPGTYCLEGSCSIRLSYRDAGLHREPSGVALPADNILAPGSKCRQQVSLPRDGWLRSDVIECAIGQSM
jgi:hypothetical protein